MSLSDEYAAAEPKRRACKVCDWYEQQSQEDKKFFDRMRDGNRSRLLSACKAQGLEAGITALRTHCLEHHDA